MADEQRLIRWMNSAGTTPEQALIHSLAMPWVKGKSGNPVGRPPAVVERSISAYVRELTHNGRDIVTFFVDALTGKTTRDMNVRVKAGIWLADRGFGSVAQLVDVEQRTEITIRIEDTRDSGLPVILANGHDPNAPAALPPARGHESGSQV